MESLEKDKKKVELIHVALHQLIEERKKEKETGKEDREDEESLLLSRLLSQLDSIEKDVDDLLKCPIEREEPSSSVTVARDSGAKEVGMDEVVRELRSVKRQNLITHCLLSVMIVVTAFWQFSEVSLLLTVKEKFSHPFRAVGDMITGSIKGRGKKPTIEAAPCPLIGVPELLHMDLPSLSLNSHEN